MIQNSENKTNDNIPAYLFHQGNNFYAYKYFGVHVELSDKHKYKYVFRTWAPKADNISVVGDFSNWCGINMHKISNEGIWELQIESDASLEGTFYKYEVKRNGTLHLKSDPYAVYSETLKKTASIIKTNLNFNWNDKSWMKFRKNVMKAAYDNDKKNHFYSSPMNIYEMHLGSWCTKNGETTALGENYLNYREIADMLIPYIKEMGYTHIELLPINEHPYDGSWGYQICGYYAPTSRYGTPEDFCYFVNSLHNSGIGVILDWVPAHFPKDEHGLYEFDGSPLYEYQGTDRQEHKGWGTRCFDVGRPEVQSFLISNALYWFREYHIDGLRIDAVASMLYLDYDRGPGEWYPNRYGNNHNLESIAFFKKLNTTVFKEFPEVLMIAEESTAWPLVTRPVFEGGLGFNFKWNMGWANDMFEYISSDPIYRQYKHDKLTFPLVYAFSENYILPVSHDEVVHGKKSLIDKMYGSYEQKFASMRAFLCYMMTIPGKKLTFMGCEYAQFREWDYENQLEWFMVDYPKHYMMKEFVKQLNNFYLKTPELWEIDDSWEGFEWIDANLKDKNMISYRRKRVNGSSVIVIINFSPLKQNDYKIFVNEVCKYKIVFSTENEEFGGNEKIINEELKLHIISDGKGQNKYIMTDVPPLSGLIIKSIDDKEIN